jgi:hypothetical protein
MNDSASGALVIAEILGFALSVACVLAVLRIFQISNDIRAIREKLVGPIASPSAATEPHDMSLALSSPPPPPSMATSAPKSPDPNVCPKCGILRSGPECPRCGLIFAKARAK